MDAPNVASKGTRPIHRDFLFCVFSFFFLEYGWFALQYVDRAPLKNARWTQLAANRPFDLLVFPCCSMFRGPKAFISMSFGHVS